LGQTRKNVDEHTPESKGEKKAAEGNTLPVSHNRPKRVARPRPGKKGRRRSKTIATKKLSREELVLAEELRNFEIDRPHHRSLCVSGPRPCPYVACKHHLYLDVNPETGSIKLNFPDLEVWELEDTCALDVADRGGITLEEVGEILNLTRERIRQVEVRGLEKLRESADGLGLKDFLLFIEKHISCD
jgi:hypothetical protein